MDYRRRVLREKNLTDGQFRVYENLTELVNETLCTNTDNFHKLQCLQRNCENCGVENLQLMNEEKNNIENSPDVQWERYEYVDLKKGSKSIRKLMLVKKKSKPYEMFAYFLQILSSFPYHQFSASWHSEQLKSLLENLPQNHCVTVNDYSENYRCFDKTEIQTGYFQKIEVSIHVSLLYRHAVLEVDGVESTVDNPFIIKEEFFVISEDDKRDQYFTHFAQKKISEYLNEINYKPTVMHEFNDGCATQYKSRHCFGILATAASDLKYDSIIRNFFETAHAKGAQDAAGGYIKRAADMSVIRGRSIIQNGKDFFDFCVKNLTTPKSDRCKRRIFTYIDSIPRDTVQNFKSVPDIRKVHCVRTTDKEAEIVVSNLSCYSCCQCTIGNYGSCRNLSIRGNCRPFRMVREVIPTAEQSVTDSEEYTLIDLICKDTILAVFTDDDEFDYYLMKSIGEVEILKNDFTDDWGISFPKGSSVVRGYYYDIVHKRNHLYKAIPKKTAMNYSVSVKYILTESEISKSGNRIQLSEDIHLSILAALEEL